MKLKQIDTDHHHTFYHNLVYFACIWKMVLYHYKYVDIAHKHEFNNIYRDNIARLFCIYNNW